MLLLLRSLNLVIVVTFLYFPKATLLPNFGILLHLHLYLLFFLFKVGFILCHGILNTDATALNLWKLALQSSSCLSLFRDEVFHIHKAAEDLFVNIRGYGIFIYFIFFGEGWWVSYLYWSFGDKGVVTLCRKIQPIPSDLDPRKLFLTVNLIGNNHIFYR